MMRLEWERWYELIPIFKAEEAYDAYVLGVVVNPDWKYDREGVVRGWIDLINRKRTHAQVVEDEDEWAAAKSRDSAPGGLRRTAHFVQNWLQKAMGEWGSVAYAIESQGMEHIEGGAAVGSATPGPGEPVGDPTTTA
jgi:hypothetical protein